MQYVEKETVRLKMVGYYNMTDEKMGFINKKGLLMDFLADTFGSAEIYKSFVLNRKDLEEIFAIENGFGCSAFEHEGKQYVSGFANNFRSKAGYRGRYFGDFEVGVYEILPNIYNDEMFSWKANKKYNVRECTYTSGLFEFHIVANSNDDVNINVKYTKCDNKHKNRVTIATININKASNESIVRAIDCWKKEFLTEVEAA